MNLDKMSYDADNVLIITNDECIYDNLKDNFEEYTFISVIRFSSKNFLNKITLNNLVKKTKVCFAIIDFENKNYNKFISQLNNIILKGTLCIPIGVNCNHINNIQMLQEIQDQIYTLIVTTTDNIMDNINSICDLHKDKMAFYLSIGELKRCLKQKSVGYTSIGKGSGSKKWEKAAINAIKAFPSNSHFSEGKNIILTIEVKNYKDQRLEDVNMLPEIIQIATNKNAKISYSVIENENIDDEVILRVFANGFYL
ncbi:hypothetical protein [Clostridium tarantellae]|uniref:Uncharacterized protein n=1 Tax=Clostridium tarantellae TaxID=39493 RepID=A0A6I1MXY7_9CLOT|nr:hypothetical protein [Clostridium tarantellae]MPQ44999.1 hypothetical protein [Clostridium tarantellae]